MRRRPHQHPSSTCCCLLPPSVSHAPCCTPPLLHTPFVVRKSVHKHGKHRSHGHVPDVSWLSKPPWWPARTPPNPVPSSSPKQRPCQPTPLPHDHFEPYCCDTPAALRLLAWFFLLRTKHMLGLGCKQTALDSRAHRSTLACCCLPLAARTLHCHCLPLRQSAQKSMPHCIRRTKQEGRTDRHAAGYCPDTGVTRPCSLAVAVTVVCRLCCHAAAPGAYPAPTTLTQQPSMPPRKHTQ